MVRNFRLALLSTALLVGMTASADAIILRFATDLSGANENPANVSPATGTARLRWNTLADTVRIRAEWADLTTNSTLAHIHCCVDPPGNVGVAVPQASSFPGFVGGPTTGSFDRIYDLTDAVTFRAAFDGPTLADKEAALLAGLLAGRAYFNIHTSNYPNGEIRGFFQQQVPEPATLTLFGVGLAALGAMGMRRRSRRGAA